MIWLLAAIGVVLVFEGLVFALAHLRLEEIMRRLLEIPADQRRVLGLLAIALGVVLLTIAKRISGL